MVAVFMAGSGLWAWQFPDAEAAPSLAYEKRPVEFSEIEGWAKDDHAAAFKTFRLSCRVFLHPNVKPKPSAEIKAVCELARMLPNTLSRDDARSFFEANFTPYFVRRPEKSALLTGYFEPEIQGSLTPNEAHSVPVYAKPDDLVLITSAVDRGDLPAELTAARMTSEGLKPYYTRREIRNCSRFTPASCFMIGLSWLRTWTTSSVIFAVPVPEPSPPPWLMMVVAPAGRSGP
ncbi:MAG: MltA domain-containing protein [Alphaproteobacteria bacterium]